MTRDSMVAFSERGMYPADIDEPHAETAYGTRKGMTFIDEADDIP